MLALFLMAVACGEVSSPTEPAGARCANPAPLFRYPDAVPDRYIIIYLDGVDVLRTTAALEEKYGISIIHIYTVTLKGFSAIVTPTSLRSLLCESTVKEIHEVPPGPSPNGNP